MKKFGLLLILLFVLAACVYGEAQYYDMPAGPGDINIIEEEYFNLPTIEGEYDIRVRHFARAHDGHLVWVHRVWYTDGGSRDFYAYERELLQDNPEYLTHRRPGGTCQVDLARRIQDIRVVTSALELEPGMVGYTMCFFDTNYLVVINMTRVHPSDIEMVYRIQANGTIVLRPLIVDSNFRTQGTYRTIVIELDNRFKPPGFNIEFICNPWGPNCPSAVFDIVYAEGVTYVGYTFSLIYGAVIPPLEGTNIERMPFFPPDMNMFYARTLQDIIDFIEPQYIRFISPDFVIFRDPLPPYDGYLPPPSPSPTPTINEDDVPGSQEYEYVAKRPRSRYFARPTHCILITNALVFDMVAMGGHHTLALKDDGTVWAWGRNFYGQLGDGTPICRATPMQVLSHVIFIAAGMNMSAALLYDGTVWAWGNNHFDQLGLGATILRYVP